MSVINLSGLSFPRNIPTQLSSQCHSLQRSCNAFFRNIFRVGSSYENLAKQDVQPQPTGSWRQRISDESLDNPVNPQQREMREHQQTLNRLFHDEMRAQNKNVHKNSDIHNIVMSHIAAVNSKNQDCGYHLSFDYLHGVTMHPLWTHKQHVSPDDKTHPHYQDMSKQKDALNKIFHSEMRKNNEVFNGRSALVHILNAQVESINAKLQSGGYQLAFNIKEGVTMHPLALAKG